MSELIICTVCNKPLVAYHGNKKYHFKCAILKHREDSIIHYALQSSLNDARWLSNKVAKDALRKYGNGVEIDPVELLYKGLDFNLEFMSFVYKGITIYCLEKIGFSLNRNSTICLWTL